MRCLSSSSAEQLSVHASKSLDDPDRGGNRADRNRRSALCALAWCTEVDCRRGLHHSSASLASDALRIESTLPYARLVRGNLDGSMKKLDALFTDLVDPVQIAA